MAVAGGKLCGGGASNISALLQTQTLTRSSQPPDARFILGSSPSFMGSCSMVSFEDGCGGKRPERSFARKFDQEDDDDDVGIDYYFHQPKKKRRLTHEQVQVLEGSFEANNNLESERRIKLANDLGLQPRQVAIWFQNRRVRWKTKKLEKDFDSMQSSFNHLKADFENLLKEVEELKAEVLHLKDRLLFKGKEQGANYRLETHPQEQIVDCSSEDEVPLFFIHAQKQEDLSSANSDVFELDSPLYIDGGHSHFAKPGNSCYLFESDRSDSSQGEEDNLSKNLLPSSYIFPKIEDVDYPESPANSCNLGFQVEDHASWFWSY